MLWTTNSSQLQHHLNTFLFFCHFPPMSFWHTAWILVINPMTLHLYCWISDYFYHSTSQIIQFLCDIWTLLCTDDAFQLCVFSKFNWLGQGHKWKHSSKFSPEPWKPSLATSLPLDTALFSTANYHLTHLPVDKELYTGLCALVLLETHCFFKEPSFGEKACILGLTGGTVALHSTLQGPYSCPGRICLGVVYGNRCLVGKSCLFDCIEDRVLLKQSWQFCWFLFDLLLF